jgi:hypothetical protein
MRTPSVCNRQAWRVYVFTDDEDKRRVLQHQNGNRGFGDRISQLLVVTCDLSAFVTIGERAQAWVDGGMFSMSLVYALHFAGLGTCCLKAPNEIREDRALRRVCGIPDCEVVIMMIAVGHLIEEFAVAQSARRALEEVVQFREDSRTIPLASAISTAEPARPADHRSAGQHGTDEDPAGRQAHRREAEDGRAAFTVSSRTSGQHPSPMEASRRR